MAGTIVTGVLIALAFLVAFSEWFYHLVVSINELVPEDNRFYYRVTAWGAGAVFFMALVFWSLAIVTECPRPEEKEGIFVYLECETYWEIAALFKYEAAQPARDRRF